MNERTNDNKKHVYRTYHSHDSDDDDCHDDDDGKKDKPLLSAMDAAQDGEICVCVSGVCVCVCALKRTPKIAKQKVERGKICSCFFLCFHTREKKIILTNKDSFANLKIESKREEAMRDTSFTLQDQTISIFCV